MKYYGNEPLTSGSMDKRKPVEHGLERPAPYMYVPNGKAVRCLKTGRIYPSVTAAAQVMGVSQTTTSKRIQNGNGWAKA